MRRLVALLTVLVAVLAAAPAQAIDLPTLQAKLAREARLAGGSSGILARDLDTGQTLFRSRDDAPRIPASVQKLFTASTALLRFGAEGTINTSAVAAGPLDPEGVLAGNLYLVGRGDPTLDAADLRLLAQRVAGTGITRIEGSVRADATAVRQRYGGAYVGGLLSGLVLNRRSGPGSAAEVFHDALKAEGVIATRRPATGAAPQGGTELGAVQSPPMRTLAKSMLVPSDNYLAELLLQDTGAAFGSAGTTTAGAAVARDTLDDFGVRPRIADGSGLSRSNRTTPRQVVRLLERMRNQETVGPALREGLPVAGRSGTLRRRMRGTAAAGNCQAKTGTLYGVSGLAGYCTARDGGDVAFAVLMNRVGTYGARAVQDRIAVALARYDG